MNDHYSTLGVRRNASIEEIKKAYLTLVRNYHPDKLPPGTPELVKRDAAEKFLVIQNAYNVLSSSERFLYDSGLGRTAEEPRTRTPSTPPPPPPPRVISCPRCGSPLTEAGCVRCIKQQSSVVYRAGRGFGTLQNYLRTHPHRTLLWLACIALAGVAVLVPWGLGDQTTGQSGRTVVNTTGQFAGTVLNTTVNQSAQVELAIQQNGNALAGCLLIQRPLYGSGQVTGSFRDRAVEFVAHSSLFDIRFTGQRDGEKMSGTYVVVRGGPGEQHGTFKFSQNHTTFADGLKSSHCPSD